MLSFFVLHLISITRLLSSVNLSMCLLITHRRLNSIQLSAILLSVYSLHFQCSHFYSYTCKVFVSSHKCSVHPLVIFQHKCHIHPVIFHLRVYTSEVFILRIHILILHLHLHANVAFSSFNPPSHFTSVERWK